MKRKTWITPLLILTVFIVAMITFAGCSDDDDGGGEDPQDPELAITSFNPTTARVGDTIVITGTGFNAEFSQNTVFFTGSESSATPGLAQAILEDGNTTSLTVIVPDNAINGPIRVRADGEEAVSSQSFTIDTSLPDPVLTSLDPTNGLPGVEVTIIGDNFGEDATVIQVSFGDTEAQVSSVTNTSIVTAVPENLEEGELQVSVSRGGVGANTTLAFTVNPLPVGVRTAYWVADEGVFRGVITETGVDITLLYSAADNENVGDRGIDLDLDAGYIYWTSFGDGVVRAPINGQGPIELLYESARIYDIALDIESQTLYVITESGRRDPEQNSFINRAPMDGSGELEPIYSFSKSTNLAVSPKLYVANNKLYWTDETLIAVLEGSLDGSTESVVLFDDSDGLVRPTGITFDPVGERIFIADNGTAGGEPSSIFVGNLDGSGDLTTLVGPGDNVRSPSDMEIDLENGFVFWLNATNENNMGETELNRASLDGQTVEVLFDGFNFANYFDLEIGVLDEN